MGQREEGEGEGEGEGERELCSGRNLQAAPVCGMGPCQAREARLRREKGQNYFRVIELPDLSRKQFSP